MFNAECHNVIIADNKFKLPSQTLHDTITTTTPQKQKYKILPTKCVVVLGKRETEEKSITVSLLHQYKCSFNGFIWII